MAAPEPVSRVSILIVALILIKAHKSRHSEVVYKLPTTLQNDTIFNVSNNELVRTMLKGIGHKAKNAYRKGGVITITVTPIQEDNHIFEEEEHGQKVCNLFNDPSGSIVKVCY